MTTSLDDDTVRNLCKIQRPDACRYLTAGADGFKCAKLTTLRHYIDERVKAGTFNARGDNCPGIPSI